MSSDGSTGTPSESGGRVGGRSSRPRPTRARPTRQRPARTVALPTLLAAAVEKNPDGIAVECGTRSLTYREIDSRSSRLARLLIERGVGPEDFVALALT
ncbi:MAG: AMP-binding protein, partial [Rhodococcus sp. (in: high G+C Gram-positive bacteria)]